VLYWQHLLTRWGEALFIFLYCIYLNCYSFYHGVWLHCSSMIALGYCAACIFTKWYMSWIRWYLVLSTKYHGMPSVLWHCWLGCRNGIRPIKNMGDGGGGHWLVQMQWRQAGSSVCLSVSVNLPLLHKVQKFSGTGSHRWSRKKGRKTVVCVRWCWAHWSHSCGMNSVSSMSRVGGA